MENDMTQSIVERQESAPVIASNSTADILPVIMQLASNPQCDLDKMDRLLSMHERMTAKQAQVEFNASMAAMQCDIPSIAERGKGHGTVRYATFEDINDVIKPIMQRHGFALTFKVVHHQGGINVTGILMHRSGHREQTTMLLPNDTSGSKNAVQAVGSSVSYGKRYVMSALLNITTRGEDDDGYAAGPQVPVITASQAAQLQCLLEKCNAKTREGFAGMYGSPETVNRGDFDKALIQLTKAAARDNAASKEVNDADHQ